MLVSHHILPRSLFWRWQYFIVCYICFKYSVKLSNY